MKECAAGPGDMQDRILKQTGTLVTTKKLLKKIIDMPTNALRERNNFNSFRPSITD